MTRDSAAGPVADSFHPQADLDWLRQWSEPALEPGLPIIDAHHHLFDRPHRRYTPDDLRRDADSGHRLVATVYLQCGEAYRREGPEHLRPVGETESVDAVAGSCGAGTPQLCAGIVSHADLRLAPALVDEVLDAHRRASPARFRGIRQSAAFEADPAFERRDPSRPGAGLLREPAFRAGFARLADHGASFDAWLYHPQLDDLIDLARAFPETSIVLDHVGGPLGIGGYAGRRDEVFAQWRASIRTLAGCPNVTIKLGGLAMRLCGFGFHEAPRPPDSQTLAQAWRPYIETCVEAFGAERCMFESNFPVDQLSCSYQVLWNAFKRVAAGCSADEKASLFAGTAARVYRISLEG